MAGAPIEAPELEPTNPAIYQGTPAATCAWPTTVAVTTGGGLCSGTLIHPRVVSYAAHCGASGQTRVNFGESSWGPALQINPDFCMTNPEYQPVQNPDGPGLIEADQGDDYAFCVLPNPVDIPVAPPLMGCEKEKLVWGEQVAIIGFGNNQAPDSGSGTKRWAVVSLEGINEEKNIAEVSFNGEPAICSGDSGGPAMIQLEDGGWRTFGITSTGPVDGCGAPGAKTFSLLTGAIPWIEANSGIDVTPCTDAEGNWNGLDPACGGFFASEAGAAFGSWNNGCVGGPVSGPSSTCGPAYDAPPVDDIGPQVAITSPEWGATYAVGDPVDVTVDAVDFEWGMDQVHLQIDGQQVASDQTEPWGWEGIQFPGDGQYELVAVAQDYAGNLTNSDPVVIIVGDGGEPPPEPPPSETGTPGTTTSGSESEVGTDSAMTLTGVTTTQLDDGDEGGASGCACTTTKGAPNGGTLALLALLGLRRRRDS